MLKSHPDTLIIWWQLCNSPDNDEETLYKNARLVHEEIRRRMPHVSIYASAQHSYSGGHVCRGEPDGPARMQRLVERLVKEGLVSAGPVMGPLTAAQTRDGCHANREGMNVLGQQLLTFFGKEMGQAQPTPKVASDPPAPLTRYEIDKAKHPKAVCNDGSTPVFYYRRGVDSGAHKWVLWFKGGGSCFDAVSCADRDRSLTSATGWTQRNLDGDGILSYLLEQNPDFYSRLCARQRTFCSPVHRRARMVYITTWIGSPK